MRRFAFLFLLFAFPAQAADALVLSCIPLRGDGPVKIDAYLDAFSNGQYPPKAFESVRLLTRFGEDVYEFFPEQVKSAVVEQGEMRISMWQPLSAGVSAEAELRGRLATKKGEPFTVKLLISADQRKGEAQVRCTID